MKASLVPLYFPNRDEDFDKQLNILVDMLGDQAEFLNPVPLGEGVSAGGCGHISSDVGDAYHMVDELESNRYAAAGDHFRIRDGVDVGLGNLQLPAFGGIGPDHSKQPG